LKEKNEVILVGIAVKSIHVPEMYVSVTSVTTLRQKKDCSCSVILQLDKFDERHHTQVATICFVKSPA